MLGVIRGQYPYAEVNSGRIIMKLNAPWLRDLLAGGWDPVVV